MFTASLSTMSQSAFQLETSHTSNEPLDISGSQKSMKSLSMTYQVINKLLIKSEDENTTTTPADDNDYIAQLADDTLSVSEDAIAKFHAEVSVEVSISIEVTVEEEVSDPLVLDLDGNGFHTTGLANGYQFDLSGRGETSKMSTITGGDAFLVLDKNNNGRIDNGTELFGDQNNAAHGFDELKKYDDNNDGVIDKSDAVYTRLQLMKTIDQEQVLVSLSNENVKSINLNYHDTDVMINRTDKIAQMSTFTFEDGRQGQVADLLLATT